MLQKIISTLRLYRSGLTERNDFYDAFFLTLLGISLWFACTKFEVMDTLFDLSRRYSAFGADELLVAVPIIGLLGFIYAWRRTLDLRHEVKRRYRAEQNARWNADHDTLTGLGNRRYMERHIGDMERQNAVAPKSYAFFAIDLDGFKKVNDLTGHQGGDDLLIAVADRLSAMFPNDIIARIGGDEFALIVECRDSFDVDKVGAALLKSITQPVFIGKIQTEVGASIGFCCFPSQTSCMQDALRFADIAMYEAKRNGKNAVRRFDMAMDEALSKRATTERALRDAIRNDIVVPFYQPLIDLDTGEIRGFEALARWRTEAGNFIEPSVFIALAEDTGLIVELSESLLRRACSEALTWPEHVTLAFNISATQLTDQKLGMRIVNILQETGFPPRRLEIEITESALVKEFEAASLIISSLHSAGIRVALDDFGTGYSSLSQLARFSFDKIKIDKSFINDFSDNEKQMKIVKSILSLGHGLGVKITAEGIEDPRQLQRLKLLGCDFGQGYLFGKAIPATHVQGLFDAEAALALTAKRNIA